jgi:hypothetical protein
MTEVRELTPYERFVEATKRVLAVPKKDVDKAMRAWRRRRNKRKGSGGERVQGR